MLETLGAAAGLAAIGAPMYARYKWRRFNSVKNRQFGRVRHLAPLVAAYRRTPAAMVVTKRKAMRDVPSGAMRRIKRARSTKFMRLSGLTRYKRRVKRRGRGKRRSTKRKVMRGRKRVVKRGNFDRFNRSGAVLRTENYKNSVSDVNSVYVIANAVAPGDSISITMCAIFRRLFEDAGIRIEAFDEEISVKGYKFSGTTDSTMRVTLAVVQQGTGVFTEYVVELATYGTINALVGYFYQFFEAWSSGYDNVAGLGKVENLVKPHCLFLSDNIANTNANINIRSQILLDEVMLEFQAEVQMRYQNRTLGETVGDNQNLTIVNDRQPMEGMFYEFSGLPKPKVTDEDGGAQGFPMISAVNGIKYVGGIGLSNGLQTIPSANYFTNCKKSYKVYLAPGSVKSHTLFVNKRMSLLTFMKSMRLQYSTSTYSKQTNYVPFPSIMVGLEDIITTNTTSELKLAFDIKRTMGCIAKYRKKLWVKDYYVTAAA